MVAVLAFAGVTAPGPAVRKKAEIEVAKVEIEAGINDYNRTQRHER